MASTQLWEVAVVVLCLVLFTLLFEVIVWALLKLFKKHNVSQVYLASVFRELTMLGIISFILFVVATQFSIDEHLKHLIEEVHMTLFLGSIFYILIVILVGLTFAFWLQRFRDFEEERKKETIVSEKSPEDAAGEVGAASGYALMSGNDGTKAWTGDMSGEKKPLKERIKGWLPQVVERYMYLRIREWAVTKHALGDDFPYYRYLRREAGTLVAELIEIDVKAWATVALTLCVASIISLMFDVDKGSILIIITLVEYAVFIFCIPMLLKIQDCVYALQAMPLPITEEEFKQIGSANPLTISIHLQLL